MDDKKLVPVTDASCLLRVSERQVRRYCNEGKLKCSKEGKAFEIEYESVLAFLKTNAPPQPDDEPVSEEGDIDKPDSDTPISDVRSAETDVRKAEESPSGNVRNALDEDTSPDMPADVMGLVGELRTAIQDVRTAQEALFDVMDRLFQRLGYEHCRNRIIEERMKGIIGELNAQPNIRLKTLSDFLLGNRR